MQAKEIKAGYYRIRGGCYRVDEVVQTRRFRGLGGDTSTLASTVVAVEVDPKDPTKEIGKPSSFPVSDVDATWDVAAARIEAENKAAAARAAMQRERQAIAKELGGEPGFSDVILIPLDRAREIVAALGKTKAAS